MVMLGHLPTNTDTNPFLFFGLAGFWILSVTEVFEHSKGGLARSEALLSLAATAMAEYSYEVLAPCRKLLFVNPYYEFIWFAHK